MPSREISVKFGIGGRLIFADATSGNISLVVVFTANRNTGKAAKNSELADVIEGICDWALKKFVNGSVKFAGAGKEVVEALQGLEETLHFIGPREGGRVMPNRFATGHRERPVEEVADVREDLHGCAAIMTGRKVDVALGRVSNNLAGAIGDGRYGMTEQVAGRNGVGHGEKLAGSGREKKKIPQIGTGGGVPNGTGLVLRR
jgi:hypothetical protein